jgi:hypothetical protein
MGVKLRECKLDAARKHGRRAALFMRRAAGASAGDLEQLLGLSATDLAACAETVAPQTGTSIAFDFELGR